jgi:hypothetical protein
MIVGAIIMGVGFVLGGFCPGTSYTAIAIGKIDAMVFTGGLFLGIFLFSEFFPFFEQFYYSGNMGSITIGEFFGISNNLVTLIFVVIAVVAFYVTWRIELRVRKNMTQYKF